MTELSFVDSHDLRQQAIERLDVLDKVKKLLLIPKVNVMTTAAVASYYEVDIEAIQKCYQRNMEEINKDGVETLKADGLAERIGHLGHDVHSVKEKGGTALKIGDYGTIKIAYSGSRCFSQRAVLRIGMLLRDSPIAKEIRTQLLNTFEVTTSEQKTQAIDNEEALYAAYGKAMFLGDKQDMADAARAIFDFQNRHIDELTIANKMLVGEMLSWSDRAQINKAVRVIASRLKIIHPYVWGMLYNELLYKHGMNLRARGKSPYIQYVKENEWKFVQQSLAALCEEKGLNVSKVMEKARMSA